MIRHRNVVEITCDRCGAKQTGEIVPSAWKKIQGVGCYEPFESPSSTMTIKGIFKKPKHLCKDCIHALLLWMETME
jgi:hypothetical protein